MTAAHYAGLSRIPLTLVGAFFVLQESDSGRLIAVAIVVLVQFREVFCVVRPGERVQRKSHCHIPLFQEARNWACL